MKITLLYQVSHYIRVKKQRNIKSWDQQNYLVIRGFCYIRPRYNEVPLYFSNLTMYDRTPFWKKFNNHYMYMYFIFTRIFPNSQMYRLSVTVNPWLNLTHGLKQTRVLKNKHSLPFAITGKYHDNNIS